MGKYQVKICHGCPYVTIRYQLIVVYEINCQHTGYQLAPKYATTISYVLHCTPCKLQWCKIITVVLV